MRLLCDGRDVGEVTIAGGFFSRLVGMLDRSSAGTPLLLRRTNSVHSIGMRFPIDVAFLAADGTVVERVHLRPNRVLRARHQARDVLEAAAGSFQQWDLRRHSKVAVQR